MTHEYLTWAPDGGAGSMGKRFSAMKIWDDTKGKKPVAATTKINQVAPAVSISQPAVSPTNQSPVIDSLPEIQLASVELEIGNQCDAPLSTLVVEEATILVEQSPGPPEPETVLDAAIETPGQIAATILEQTILEQQQTVPNTATPIVEVSDPHGTNTPQERYPPPANSHESATNHDSRRDGGRYSLHGS